MKLKQILLESDNPINEEELLRNISEYSTHGDHFFKEGSSFGNAINHIVEIAKQASRHIVESEEDWLSFGRAIGNPSWVKDSRFATLTSRKVNETELDRLVEEWTIQYAAEDVMKLLQRAGVAAGIVATGEDISNDPQHKHRGYFHDLDHPEMGHFNYPDHPYKLSETPAEISASPVLGQHTELVIKEILGFSEEEYVELLVAEVLE